MTWTRSSRQPRATTRCRKPYCSLLSSLKTSRSGPWLDLFGGRRGQIIPSPSERARPFCAGLPTRMKVMKDRLAPWLGRSATMLAPSSRSKAGSNARSLHRPMMTTSNRSTAIGHAFKIQARPPSPFGSQRDDTHHENSTLPGDRHLR